MSVTLAVEILLLRLSFSLTACQCAVICVIKRVKLLTILQTMNE